MDRRTLLKAGGASLIAISTAAVLKPLSAKAADFSGETIEWWIPFREGGGSDTWARALAPALGRSLPGEPPVILVHNAQSGAIGGTKDLFSRLDTTGGMLITTTRQAQHRQRDGPG